MEEWTTVFSFFSNHRVSTDIPTQSGVITRMSANSPEILIFLYEDKATIRAFLPFEQRLQFMLEVIENCSAFKICVDVDTVKKRITKYYISVNPQEFNSQMADDNAITGEVYIVQLMKQTWQYSQMNMNISSPINSGRCKQIENWRIQLFPHQVNSVNWMKCHEENILRSTLKYSVGIPIPGTSWFFDYNSETFTKETTMKFENMRGGILADGTGSGKTACILRLIMETIEMKSNSNDNYIGGKIGRAHV